MSKPKRTEREKEEKYHFALFQFIVFFSGSRKRLLLPLNNVDVLIFFPPLQAPTSQQTPSRARPLFVRWRAKAGRRDKRESEKKSRREVSHRNLHRGTETRKRGMGERRREEERGERGNVNNNAKER